MSDMLSILQTRRNNKFSIADKDWVIFINDHKDHIRKNGILINVTNADRDRFKHKFDHFLRDKGCDSSIMWIAKLINDQQMFDDFTTNTSIIIPSYSTIVNLYRQYRTSRNIS